MKDVCVIYDGQCAFCIRSLKFIRRFDTLRVLKFYDSHDQDILKRDFPMVKTEDTEEAMLVVTEEGEVFIGFYAFRRLIWSSPWLWWLLPLFYFPGSAYLGIRLYSWVARNRSHLGCQSQST